jgi:hypothetical protein
MDCHSASESRRALLKRISSDCVFSVYRASDSKIIEIPCDFSYDLSDDRSGATLNEQFTERDIAKFSELLKQLPEVNPRATGEGVQSRAGAKSLQALITAISKNGRSRLAIFISLNFHSIGEYKPPFPIPETQSAFHLLAQQSGFRRRDARQQSRSFARSNQSLTRSPKSNRL